jgi:hypothetical protein
VSLPRSRTLPLRPPKIRPQTGVVWQAAYTGARPAARFSGRMARSSGGPHPGYADRVERRDPNAVRRDAPPRVSRRGLDPSHGLRTLAGVVLWCPKPERIAATGRTGCGARDHPLVRKHPSGASHPLGAAEGLFSRGSGSTRLCPLLARRSTARAVRGIDPDRVGDAVRNAMGRGRQRHRSRPGGASPAHRPSGEPAQAWLPVRAPQIRRAPTPRPAKNIARGAMPTAAHQRCRHSETRKTPAAVLTMGPPKGMRTPIRKTG